MGKVTFTATVEFANEAEVARAFLSQLLLAVGACLLESDHEESGLPQPAQRVAELV